MGVLCEISGTGKFKDETFIFDGDSYEEGTAPEALLPITAQTRLIKMNDDDCKSFTEIADYIEANNDI